MSGSRAGHRGGVEPDAVGDTDKGGCLLSHEACSFAYPDPLEVLLALGADPTRATHPGKYTPCMTCASEQSGSVPCLRLLVAGGAGGKLEGDAVNVLGQFGKTALDHVDSNNTEFVAVLRDELGGKRAADLKRKLFSAPD